MDPWRGQVSRWLNRVACRARQGRTAGPLIGQVLRSFCVFRCKKGPGFRPRTRFAASTDLGDRPRRRSSPPSDLGRRRLCAATLPARRANCVHKAGGSSIEVAGDSVTPKRITFTPDRLITADILDDGRILCEIARTPGDGIQREIWTVFPDGSGAALLSMQLSGRIHAELYYWDGRSAVHADLRRPTGAWAVQPTAITVRPRPKDYPASLLPNRKEAVLLFHAASTREQVPTAASVRALTWEPSAGVRSLGVLPLEADGSFYAAVDSDRPLRFQFLDSSGRTIGEQESWIWLRPGEQRMCVGCHASTRLAPANRVPVALKSGRPSRFRDGQGAIRESETLPYS